MLSIQILIQAICNSKIQIIIQLKLFYEEKGNKQSQMKQLKIKKFFCKPGYFSRRELSLKFRRIYFTSTKIISLRMFKLGIFFRVTQPLSSSIFHTITHKYRQPSKTSQFKQFQLLPEQTESKHLLPLIQFDRIQPEFKINTQNTQPEQEDIIEIQQQQTPFSSLQSRFQRNCIDKRIKFLQYEANNPSQDSMVVAQLNTINAYTVSIFDGHGGPQLAQYSKQKINTFIDFYLKDYANKNKGRSIGDVLREALKWSYNKLQDTYYEIYEQKLKQGNKKIKNVGTCAITAIVYNDTVYIGNAGDSQGMFILSDSKSLFRKVKMNERLNTNNKKERQRIVQKWKNRDQEIIVQDSKNCYYLKGRLQPTRTIGDYYLKKQNHYNGHGTFKGPYLSCEPDIEEYKLTKQHKYMIIASDGVWDVLSGPEVMASLIKQKQFDVNKTIYEQQSEDAPYLSNIVSGILEKSSAATGKSLEELKKMEKGKRRNYHDDITIVVVSLDNQL